jgi:hypothetical protein
MSPRKIPSKRTLNSELTEQMGREVVLFEVLPVAPGQTLLLTFEETSAGWRQGVWLGTEGEFKCNGHTSSQVVLWSDTAPRPVEIEIVATDGLLRLYNVWDSGRRLGDYESQMATSWGNPRSSQ